MDCGGEGIPRLRVGLEGVGRTCGWAVAAALLGLAGCVGGDAPTPQVVVYTAHDAVFSEPILAAFHAATQIEPRPKFDVESTKTVGLVNAILREANRPRCDVFWNNEILNTLRLQKKGLLEPYAAPGANAFPPQYYDPQGYWHGFGARARVLACNVERTSPSERPTSILDLTAPRWRGEVGIAKPLFGTTATHAACLYATWGAERTEKFFADLKANQVQILGGNKQVAELVARGALAWGLTDTDDALQMIDQGMPVTIIYPDQQENGLGTLFIPNSVAIIKNAPHPAEARRLVDYLLSPAVEAALASGPAGQIPLNPQVQVETRIETPRTIRAMQVDFAQAAEQWDAAARFLAREF